MGLKVRHATLDDLSDIQSLNHELFISDNHFNNDLNVEWPYEDGTQYFRDCITNTDTHVSLVAEEGKLVIGYLNGRLRKQNSAYIGTRAEIENMCVAENYRDKGAGSILIDEFRNWAKSKHADRLIVEAFSGNDDAIRFYEKNGFEPYSETLSQKLT